MANFLKFLVFCLLGIGLMYLNIKFGSQINDYLFNYIKLIDIDYSLLGLYRDKITISILGHNSFIQVLWGLFLVLLSVLPILLYNEENLNNSSLHADKVSSIFKEYFLIPTYFVFAIWCFMLFVAGFPLILNGFVLLLYSEFDIKFFIEHNPIWIIWALFSLPWIALIAYLYNTNLPLLLIIKEKLKKSVIFLLILLISLIFLIKSDKIYFSKENLCIWNQCYLYSDIKAINIDHSGYEMEIILKSFDTKLPIFFSKWDLFRKEECDSDEWNSWCWLIHEPIIDINDRLTFIVQEDQKSEGDEDRISSEELSYLSEQKNFEKTLNAVVAWKVEYPETLNQDWIIVLRILHKKTNLYPKVINLK